MRIIVILIVGLITTKTFSQSINYCNYFSLEVKEIVKEGKKLKLYSPVCLLIPHNKFGKFLVKHSTRFDYILNKKSIDYKDVSDYYPDTVKIRNEFCNKIINESKMQKYLTSLTPKKIVLWEEPADTFSIKELMLVASRFFFCDGINKNDTTIQSHICIGINGMSELESDKDLTLLAAFSIEAIFSFLTSKKEPLFYSEFYSFKENISKTQINYFKNFDSYLIEIRNLCYKEMEKNKNLKANLLKYYKKNKSNFNFILM